MLSRHILASYKCCIKRRRIRFDNIKYGAGQVWQRYNSLLSTIIQIIWGLITGASKRLWHWHGLVMQANVQCARQKLYVAAIFWFSVDCTAINIIRDVVKIWRRTKNKMSSRKKLFSSSEWVYNLNLFIAIIWSVVFRFITLDVLMLFLLKIIILEYVMLTTQLCFLCVLTLLKFILLLWRYTQKTIICSGTLPKSICHRANDNITDVCLSNYNSTKVF